MMRWVAVCKRGGDVLVDQNVSGLQDGIGKQTELEIGFGDVIFRRGVLEGSDLGLKGEIEAKGRAKKKEEWEGCTRGVSRSKVAMGGLSG